MEEGVAMEERGGAEVSGVGWSLPCSLSSLLAMNCRARAEGLARRLQAKVRLGNGGGGGTSALEQTSLVNPGPEDHYNSMECRHSSLDDPQLDMLGDESLKPIHVVTSEPTLHLCLPPPPASLNHVQEQDSDVYYDFDLASPDDGGEAEEADDDEGETEGQEARGNGQERPESGCVTSVTSPVMFDNGIDEDEHEDGEGPSVGGDLFPPDVESLVCSPDADLHAVRQILSYTSLHEEVGNGGGRERGDNGKVEGNGGSGVDMRECGEEEGVMWVAECGGGGGAGKVGDRSSSSSSLHTHSSPVTSPVAKSESCWCHTALASSSSPPEQRSTAHVHPTSPPPSFSDYPSANVCKECSASCRVENCVMINNEGQRKDKQGQGNTQPQQAQGGGAGGAGQRFVARVTLRHSSFETELVPTEDHEASQGGGAKSRRRSRRCRSEGEEQEDKELMMGNGQGNSSSCGGESIPNTAAPATVTSNPWPISVSEPPHSFPDHHLYPTSTQNMEAREEDDEEEEEEDVQEEKTEVFYMEDDETEEIDTLNEDLEHDDAEEEVNEEDVEEETILTGKFKNIRGYQERVRRLSDDTEDRPPPVSVIVYDDTHLTETKEDNKEEEIEEVVSESVSGTELASQLSELQVEDVGIQVDAEDAEGSGEDAGARSSSEETDPERIEDFKMRIKRSSSLKCGKTPPGTPGRKKIVRFADMLGLDLAAVRTFLGGGVPHVPRSAFWDLQVEKQSSNASARLPTMDFLPNVPRRVLTPLFQQPGCQLNFLERVRNQRVVVESVDVGDDMSVRGIVRVLNLDYHKNVYVRYTFDQWRNFHEATATYVPGSYDGLTDRFSFLLWGSFLQDNGALVFCVRYQTLDQEFWDNNYGRNYSLQCYTTSGLPGEKGPDGSTRPQNSSSVQQLFGSDHHGSSTDSRHLHHHHQHNYHSFSSGSPTTPHDPWTTRFF